MPIPFTNGNVVFEYKGKNYGLIGQVKFKHPDTREWINAVAYRKIENDETMIYVRELNEFHERFKYAGCLNAKGELIPVNG